MQQLAPRAISTAQEHANANRRATDENLLREHLDPSHSLPPPPYSSIESMQQGSSPPLSSLHHDGSADMEDDGSDGRKAPYGKRELSTSKRAAQNRAAQRAFRQRKEGYIKKLEEQVRDYSNLSESFKSLQQENYQLRDYVLKLQSRLLDSQGEVPPPPSNLNGLEPEHAGESRPGPHQQLPQPNHLVSHPATSQATLPRLSELGALSPPQGLSGPIPPTQKDTTPAQAALQGSSILQNPVNQ